MTEAKLIELQQMHKCLKALQDVRVALNTADDDHLLSIQVTATHAGNAYASLEDMPAYLPIAVYEPFKEEFSKFISTQLCRLQKAFDKA